MAIYPCPSLPKAEGGSLPQFLGVLFLCLYCCSDTLRLHPGIVGLFIREALRHRGMGWQEYDRTFRRHRHFPSLECFGPGPTGNRSSPPGLFCGLCREPDHSTGQCALSVTQQPASSSSLTTFSRRPRHPETVAGFCASWNQGCCAFPRGIVPSGTSVRCAAAIIGVLTAPLHQWAQSIIGVSRLSSQVPRPLPAPKHRTEVD